MDGIRIKQTSLLTIKRLFKGELMNWIRVIRSYVHLFSGKSFKLNQFTEYSGDVLLLIMCHFYSYPINQAEQKKVSEIDISLIKIKSYYKWFIKNKSIS